jgi:predicted secreted hydrolase
MKIATASIVAGLMSTSAPFQSGTSTSQQASSSQQGWKSAAPGRPIVLPADHASHPEYKLEWWYYTGNLDAEDGRRFGYQVTFFRIGIRENPANRSRWAVRDLYMTHVALTDVTGRRFLFDERLNRAGPGWAGAATDRYRVWNEDWEASLDGPTHRLRAAARDRHGLVGGGDAARALFALDLHLTEVGPPALHGDGGYSQKGSDPGNASHYYSLPRLPTRGTIVVDGRSRTVTGLSWMDHEFGTSFLESGQLGWDWLAIQLQDGRSVMLYRFRRSDGAFDPHSHGTLVERDGRARPLSLDRIAIEPARLWTSPASGARYPTAWTIRLPAEEITLSIAAVLDDQELRTTESAGVTYWEGAVDATGTVASRPVTGRGYLEMTGYAGGRMPTYLR